MSPMKNKKDWLQTFILYKTKNKKNNTKSLSFKLKSNKENMELKCMVLTLRFSLCRSNKKRKRLKN